MSLPLEGIKVIDLSRYLPGPFCTQLLADFGAEIIKVEQPGMGDPGRQLPPVVNGVSSRFYTVNRNKKSVTLDIRTEEGKKIFKRLAENCDIVVDQFRPGFMDELGLGYDELKKGNNRMIYCAISGYGLTGPMRTTAGHDLNYLNLAGITGLTGGRDGRPAMSGAQIADIAGGTLYAIIAILLALASRDRTGEGQLCDISMLDGAVSLLAYTLGEWAGDGVIPSIGYGVLSGGYACYNIYESADHKYLSLGAVETKFWAEFCRRLERPQYIQIQWDKEKQAGVIADIDTILKEKTQQEWVEFFSDSDICFTPVLDLQEMTQNLQVKDRQMIQTIEDPGGSGKTMVLTGVPIKLSATPGEIKLNFPALGEHNNEIFTAAGYSHEEIEMWRKQGII